jgi:hypothetical protein
MLASRRWRDWSPIENISKSPEFELTELTKTPPEPILSVLSVPTLPISENSGQSDHLPEHDLDAQCGSLFAWMNVACAFHARVFGGVAKLHLAYCEWEYARGGVPCNRDTFLCLLEESGFLVGNIGGELLVSGLTFRDDVEATLAAVEGNE